MDLLKGNLKKIYFKYLFASFGSALIVSVYSLVDCVMVGQYEGPDGVAALAIVAPVWNIIYSLGLLFGIGGSVLMSAAKAREMKAAGTAFTQWHSSVPLLSLYFHGWALFSFRMHCCVCLVRMTCF